MQGLDCHHRCNLSSPLYRWYSAFHPHTVSRSGYLRSNKYSLFPQPYRNPDSTSRRNNQGLFQSALMHCEVLHFCDCILWFLTVLLPLQFLGLYHPTRNIFHSDYKSSTPCYLIRHRLQVWLLFLLKCVAYKKPSRPVFRNWFVLMENRSQEKSFSSWNNCKMDHEYWSHCLES